MIQPITSRFNFNSNNHSANAKQINFGAIRIKEISPKYASKSAEIIRETTRFADFGMGVKKLGQGLFSEVFEFLKLNNVVVKRSLRGGDTFEQEAKALQAVPETLKDTQQFVARVWDDETLDYYLLSTKVTGKDPDVVSNPWSGTHLRKLFSGMFEMDKVGLYHGDLNNGNIKLTNDGNVNFLDFQWGTVTNKYRFFELNKEQCHPSFLLIQNSQMFEMAEVPYYLKKMETQSDGKHFLSTYLQEKSKYHEARVNFIEKITDNWDYPSEFPQIKKGLDFERAQAQIYKRPDENILKLEAYKIQFLSSFREASKYLDPNTPSKNIITAPASYLVAMNNAQLLRHEIVKQAGKPTSEAKREYLLGMKGFADYWYNNLETWTKDAFYYPYRHTQNKLLKWEKLHNFDDPNVNIEYFEPMWNILKKVDYNYQPHYSSNFNIKSATSNSKMRKISEDMPVSGLLAAFVANKKEVPESVKVVYEKLKKAYAEDRGLDVINSSLLLARRGYEWSQKSFRTGEYGNYQIGQRVVQNSVDLAEDVFRIIYNSIKRTNLRDNNIKGYSGMGDFK